MLETFLQAKAQGTSLHMNWYPVTEWETKLPPSFKNNHQKTFFLQLSTDDKIPKLVAIALSKGHAMVNADEPKAQQTRLSSTINLQICAKSFDVFSQRSQKKPNHTNLLLPHEAANAKNAKNILLQDSPPEEKSLK